MDCTCLYMNSTNIGIALVLFSSHRQSNKLFFLRHMECIELIGQLARTGAMVDLIPYIYSYLHCFIVFTYAL